MKNYVLTKTIEELRNEGYAVFVQSPKDLGGVHPDVFLEALDYYTDDAMADVKRKPDRHDFALGYFVKEKLADAGDMSFEVDVDYGFGTVCIKDLSDDPWDDIFMQGEDASNFIEEVNNLYNRAGNLGLDEAEMYVALPYVETIWN